MTMAKDQQPPVSQFLLYIGPDGQVKVSEAYESMA